MSLLSSAAGHSLAAYLSAADIVASTSTPIERTVAEDNEIRRSFVGSSSWGTAFGAGQIIHLQTASADAPPILLSFGDIDGPAFAALDDFYDLASGWDGENAAAPNPVAIRDAARFLRAIGPEGEHLEPTLHVDGSVILEIEGGSLGSLRFRGDGTIIYSLEGARPGTVAFNGFSVPQELWPALGV
jgi:hypothetical protein